MLTEQINRMLKLSGINEARVGTPKEWYRGTGGSSFNGNSNDELGPGIYFTSSLDDARRYGQNIWKIAIKGKIVPIKKYLNLAHHLTWLIKQKDGWEDDAYNWSENPQMGLQKAVKATIQYNDTAAECFQQVWFDFYRHDPLEFVKNLSKLYDAMVIKKQEGVFHMVVYNEKAIVTLDKFKGGESEEQQGPERNYWGAMGAGVIPICAETGRALIGLRSGDVMEPYTWGGFGGKLDDGENDPESAALREMREELRYNGSVRMVKGWVFTDGSFEYHNYIGLVDKEFEPELNWENDKAIWMSWDELQHLPRKHFGLTEFINNSRQLFEKYMK